MARMVVYGGKDNESFTGTVGNDIMYGGPGNDGLDGGYGSIFRTYTYIDENGQMRSSTYESPNYFISGNDHLDGGAGDDTLRGWGGKDTLLGGSGNDRLYGGSDDDTLRGGIGNDYLSGGTGNDTMYGDSGNDELLGGNGDDTLRGGDGEDLLRGEDGNDIIAGGNGDDTIYAGVGDRINPGAGDDHINFIDAVGHEGKITLSGFKVHEDVLDFQGTHLSREDLWIGGNTLHINDGYSTNISVTGCVGLNIDQAIQEGNILLPTFDYGFGKG